MKHLNQTHHNHQHRLTFVLPVRAAFAKLSINIIALLLKVRKHEVVSG